MQTLRPFRARATVNNEVGIEVLVIGMRDNNIAPPSFVVVIAGGRGKGKIWVIHCTYLELDDRQINILEQRGVA